MEFWGKIGAVALGGSIGAVARYLVNISPLSTYFPRFPLPTFVINITGSFLIGFLFVLVSEKFAMNESLRLAIFVGFLGAFTTFSAFEFEIFELFRARVALVATTYFVLSVLVGFIGVVLGVMLAKRIV